MKKLFFSCMLSVSLFMILMIPANAQEKGQKKMHVVVEENGRVITDTTVIFGSDVPEEEIQATISGITGEKGHPCPVHHQPAVHCDTMVYKCRHGQKSELDTLLEVSGKPFTYAPSDTCRHAYVPCEKHTEKAEAGQKPCQHMHKEIIRMGEHGGKETVIIEDNGDIIIHKGQIPGDKCIKVIVESDGDTAVSEKIKEVRIIKTSGDDKDMPEGCAKKIVEKKVIITTGAGDNREEKIIILENSDGSGEKVIEEKVIITSEGDKAEKAKILESPAETSKKAEKEE